MGIGERIKNLRKGLNLTQLEFCKKIGLQRNSISLVESGKRNISNQAILSICREFNVSEDWLRDGVGEMFVPTPNDNLAAYLEGRGVGKTTQTFVLTYFKLPPEKQKAVDNYLDKVVAEISAERTQDSVEQTEMHELTADEWAEIQRLRQSRE